MNERVRRLGAAAWQGLRRGPGVLAQRLHAGRRSRTGQRALAGLLVLGVALVGAVLGLLLGGRTAADVGPFQAELRLAPSWTGETSVFIPPLGSLHLDSHDGPAGLSIHLGALDQARTQQMITDPGGVTRATASVADDVIDGVVRVGLGGLGAAVLGAMLLAALVFRNVRKVAWTGGLALTLVAGSLGLAAGTFRVGAVEEPRYEGLLVYAPALVGDVARIANEYQRYTDQLQSLVTNATILYTALSDLPDPRVDDTMTRVLHVADLHLNPAAWPVMRTVVEQYNVDFIIDSGDIVDWGSGPENEYIQSIRLMRVPYVYVRGNHDSIEQTQATVGVEPNAIVLDDEVVTVEGLTVGGIGDPRFTPDQETRPHTDEETTLVQQSVINSGVRLADTIGQHGEPVDIAAVHDPLAAGPLDGVVPVVLAGHRHQRIVTPLETYQREEPDEELDEEHVPDPSGTLLMIQGSTGGAGLRGLEGEHPMPLALSVLYFNPERQLVAYDDITVGGHGLSEASVQRHLIDLPAEQFAPAPTPTPPLDGVAD